MRMIYQLRGMVIRLVRETLGSKYIAVSNKLRSNRTAINGKGNVIESRGMLRRVQIRISGNNNTVVLHSSARLFNTLIYILGNNNRIVINEDVRFREGDLWIENDNNLLMIGAGTTVVSAHLAVTENNKKITIGKDCMLSKGIELRTGDSHSIIDLTSNSRINYAADIVVEDHVWIGANATVLKGVRIGSNCIVGTGAIVTDSIAPNSIAAGVPARVVKNNVTWSRHRLLEEE